MIDPKTSFAVWIVEDNRALRISLAAALVELRPAWSVNGYACCEDALARPALEAPAVIVMDLGLPGLSGLECIGAARGRWPAVEVVVFTVFDDAEKIFAAICAGASGYLLKSEPADAVVRAVEEVSQGGSAMHPQVARKVLDFLSGRRRVTRDTLLSERERGVLQVMAEGLTKKEIATRFGLSIHTVDNYLRRIYRKLHVNTMQGAVAKAIRDSLL